MEKAYSEAVTLVGTTLFWGIVLALLGAAFLPDGGSQFCWGIVKSFGVCWVAFIAFVSVVEAKKREMLDKEWKGSILNTEK